jgi:CubicO group peptidase (beta-lactamase class C family)
MDFSTADAILSQAIGTVTPAAQLVIYHNGAMVHDVAMGFLDPETQSRPVNAETLFDLASVTKLFTTTAFMTLVEEGKISVDDVVVSVLPEFSGMRSIQPYEDPLNWNKTVSIPPSSKGEGRGVRPSIVDAGKVTFRNLLAHNSGLPAWRAFKDQPDAESAMQLALHTFFAYPTGERVLYSDVGLILLGLAASRLAGSPLDETIDQRVIKPMGLSAHFQPAAPLQSSQNIAPTEFCKWRGRRIVGEVHDESAWRLGGVAGHAGLFAHAQDVAVFGQTFLDASLLQRETINEMTRLQAEFQNTRRGLGFALWSRDPEASSNPFNPTTYGHTGFTGTCLWIDPSRALVVAFLTNDVYNGREERGIADLRVQVHRAILESVDAT